ncbi:MerR family transcriptional regulator [Clostridium sp. MSJ-11]|uniref:MerR family transcriptional regulator n=1 Tax=Clostridium mobile TaxID=2841512 RepID=A0ABS6EDN7_9CLOT|nr:MerR family transcriptional regulator [Clostridium mobile]MBU5483319.1 MerR family transcriptional regulator [Clostridium mobile]
MFIKEVCTTTKLTKKAIEYYIEQGLIFPDILENGYRDFSTDDIEKLKKIAVLRKLGLGTDDIKIALSDENGETLQKLSIQKELRLKQERAKQSLLDKLSTGKSFDEVSVELKSIEKNETITEKLLDAFPGYYGRFITLHFSRFLNEPISTKEQQVAYEEIVSFLDNVPALNFPKDLQEFLIECTKNFSTQSIIEMNEKIKQSIENPENFLSENKEMLDWYLKYKQSEEYKNSPTYKIQEMLKEFNSTSGYYDIFIPAMKKLSTSYSDYYKQLEIANEKLLSQYPEIQNLSN